MTGLLKKFFSGSAEANKLSGLKRQYREAISIIFQQHPDIHEAIIVIGQSESGKSILSASNSEGDAKKVFSFEAYQYGGALFIQIPSEGFLLNENQLQQQLWQYLARQLKKHRGHCLVTRCLICIDTHDFLTRSSTSNQIRLSQISTAVKSLTSVLRHPLTISCFFTKCDLIPGFVEFFEHESQEFLEQTFGILLEKHDEETLSNELNHLIKTLNERLIWSLHHEKKPEKLYLIKAFPLAMETLKQKIEEIMPMFFNEWQKNRYLHVESLYFVSCRQFRQLSGSLIPEIAKTNNAHHLQDKHLSFFVRQALENQLSSKDGNKLSATEKLTRGLFVILCALSLFAFSLYHAQQFSHHIQTTQSANQSIMLAQAFLKIPESELNLEKIGAELNNLAHALKKLKQDQQASLLEKYIFTSDPKLETKLFNSYQRILSEKWIPLLTQNLEAYINSNLATDPANSYIALKIYVMLTQTEGNLDIPYLEKHVASLLNLNVNSLPHFLTDMQKNSLVSTEDSPFITKTREFFANLSDKKLAYILLFSNLPSSHPISVTSVIETKPRILQVDSEFSQIAEMYSADSFNLVYKKQLPDIAHEVIHGNAVLGPYEKNTETEGALLGELQEDYLKLYSETWEQTIQHIHYVPATSLAMLIEQLKIITSQHSPFLAMLNLSQMNTSFVSIEQTSSFLTTLNDTLTPESTPENNVLYRTFSLLIKLQNQLLSFTQEKNTNVCVILQNEHRANTQNPTEAQQIRLLASQLSEPLQTWFKHMLDNYQALLEASGDQCS